MPTPRTDRRRSRLIPPASLVGGLLLLGLSSCDDPEKEARLKWREEEASAKEIDLVKREQKLASERSAIEALQAQVAQREQQIEVLRAQLAEEIEKARRSRRELEIKQLRGAVPNIAAERAIVIDAQSSDVIFEKNADKRGPIASTQKLLTALVIVESGDLDATLTVEQSDTVCAPVRIGLKAGQQYTRRDLLTALLVKSSNDIAQALARDNAGSLEAFAAKMNERAKTLGLQNSFFVNPHGLPDEKKEQYSTARDLSQIARAVDKLPDIRAMVRQKTYKFTMPGSKQPVVLDNTNRVLRTNAYCDGMKTGFTEAAGHCLVCSGEKNGRRRIVIVLNDSSASVWKDAEALLEWALKA
ncbi:MAG: serine hydrolase [Verrucomicrobiaceae bacterium]|nr:serine hydrolase [Verrucomicrobiaceae bacterium]